SRRASGMPLAVAGVFRHGSNARAAAGHRLVDVPSPCRAVPRRTGSRWRVDDVEPLTRERADPLTSGDHVKVTWLQPLGAPSGLGYQREASGPALLAHSSTRSGVIGSTVGRLPRASWIALAADAPGAERAQPLPGLEHDGLDVGEVRGGGDQVLEEAAGEVHALVDHDLLQQRHPEALSGSAAYLPLD